MRTIVKTENVKKFYEQTKALQGVSITVHANDFIAVLGKSGSGKTTLFHILDGLIQPDEGEIWINGKKAEIHSPTDALSCGVGMVHQQFMLVPNMTVAENIAIGKEPTKGIFTDLGKVKAKIKEFSEKFGL